MVNKIIEGISKRLNEVFGDGYDIYEEDVEQGLQNPYFLITILSDHKTESSGNRSKRERLFMVQYFPGDTPFKKKECRVVGEKLMNSLEFIDCGVRVRCSDMSYAIKDNVLQLSMNCNTIVTKIVEMDKMQEIQVQEKLKGK
ncbi:phage tail terminator family protein [Robinsoniella peoriensis]|uniref:phage tail terminator family protein n=1 Tax=Robinsoniella peoriensis TaxID=180332 RepID=UPI00085BBBD9|nr:hypothetical protein [Robinsoniella peoriensis]